MSDKVCLWCGGELPKRRRKYCCDEHAIFYWEEYIAPLWWGNAKEVALRKAGNRCQWVDKEGNRCERRGKLEVHHIVPLEKGESYHKSPKNTQSNLIVLCRPHHEDAHRIHPKDKSEVIPKEQMLMELNV